MHFHRCVLVVSHVLSSNRCYVFSQIKTNNLFPSISCTSICRSVQTKRVGLIMQRVLHPSIPAEHEHEEGWHGCLAKLKSPSYIICESVSALKDLLVSPQIVAPCTEYYNYFASMGTLTCVHQIGVTHYYSHRSTNVLQCVAIHSGAML